jgi:hypothetical protein
MLQFEKNHAVTLVQKWFGTNYGKEVPTYEKIVLQVTQTFTGTDCLCARKRFETGTSRIRSVSVKYSTTTFGPTQ